MSELRKKLKKNENIELVAFKTNSGIAIGKKNPNGLFCDAVVVMTERKDGTIEVVINKDVLSSIEGNIHMKNLSDPMPE